MAELAGAVAPLPRLFKRVLGILRNVRTFALVPVGYPRGNFGPVRRRPAAETIHWEGW